MDTSASDSSIGLKLLSRCLCSRSVVRAALHALIRSSFWRFCMQFQRREDARSGMRNFRPQLRTLWRKSYSKGLRMRPGVFLNILLLYFGEKQGNKWGKSPRLTTTGFNEEVTCSSPGEVTGVEVANPLSMGNETKALRLHPPRGGTTPTFKYCFRTITDMKCVFFNAPNRPTHANVGSLKTI